ncbi:uncharacterized protein LOC141927691 [Strix aluco]|uniref:uncharacterized protein LOC141927691 n=1 Tax=Strix aluco TaxID=111821 RepID=UPI003DA57192
MATVTSPPPHTGRDALSLLPPRLSVQPVVKLVSAAPTVPSATVTGSPDPSGGGGGSSCGGSRGGRGRRCGAGGAERLSRCRRRWRTGRLCRAEAASRPRAENRPPLPPPQPRPREGRAAKLPPPRPAPSEGAKRRSVLTPPPSPRRLRPPRGDPREEGASPGPCEGAAALEFMVGLWQSQEWNKVLLQRKQNFFKVPVFHLGYRRTIRKTSQSL